jgi:hypothetical protein
LPARLNSGILDFCPSRIGSEDIGAVGTSVVSMVTDIAIGGIKQKGLNGRADDNEARMNVY